MRADRLVAVLTASLLVAVASGQARKKAPDPDQQARDQAALAAGWVSYKGRVISPQDFTKGARSVSSRGLDPRAAARLQGVAVTAVGVVQSADPKAWELETLDKRRRRGSTGIAMIDPTKLGGFAVKVGHRVQVWGVVDVRPGGAVIEAWFAALLPPGLTWEGDILNDIGVIRNLNGEVRQQGYQVGDSGLLNIQGVVTNTGYQPFTRIKVECRLYHHEAYTAFKEEFEIAELPVGEAQEFRVDVKTKGSVNGLLAPSMFVNINQNPVGYPVLIGGIPVEFRVTDYEL